MLGLLWDAGLGPWTSRNSDQKLWPFEVVAYAVCDGKVRFSVLFEFREMVRIFYRSYRWLMMMICEDMILYGLLCTVSWFTKGIMKIVDVRRRLSTCTFILFLCLCIRVIDPKLWGWAVTTNQVGFNRNFLGKNDLFFGTMNFKPYCWWPKSCTRWNIWNF